MIDRNKNNIPKRIFICAFRSSPDALVRLTEKIMTGILKIIMIRLPIAKFLLFNKFIDPEIDEMHVIIGDPIRKLKKM